MYGIMDPFSWKLLKEHQERILREAERDRLVRGLRANRKRSYGRALVWELERVTGRLRKALAVTARDEKETT